MSSHFLLIPDGTQDEGDPNGDPINDELPPLGEVRRTGVRVSDSLAAKLRCLFTSYSSSSGTYSSARRIFFPMLRRRVTDDEPESELRTESILGRADPEEAGLEVERLWEVEGVWDWNVGVCPPSRSSSSNSFRKLSSSSSRLDEETDVTEEREERVGEVVDD